MMGLVATMSVEGGTDGGVFGSYVEHILAPHLRPDQVAIMDNLKAHKVAGVREAIIATGASFRRIFTSLFPGPLADGISLVEAEPGIADPRGPDTGDIESGVARGPLAHHGS